jgi:multisubunit Na+/H+ antiporter MnhG subunit
MAEELPSGPVELGAQMDYREHEKSYGVFIAVTKYATLGTVALLIAMAFGFFAGGGFFSATILFFLLCAVGAYLLRDF